MVEFEEGFKKQFTEFKRDFRLRVDNLRTVEYEYFVKVNEGKAKVNEEKGVYKKIEEEAKKM
jgi:hypothetical protein